MCTMPVGIEQVWSSLHARTVGMDQDDPEYVTEKPVHEMNMKK